VKGHNTKRFLERFILAGMAALRAGHASAKPQGSPSLPPEAQTGTAFYRRSGISDALAGLGLGDNPAAVGSRRGERPVTANNTRARLPAHYSPGAGAVFGLCGTSCGVPSSPTPLQSRARPTRPQTAGGARPTRPQTASCSRPSAGTSRGYLAASDPFSRSSFGAAAPPRPLSARVSSPSEGATDVLQGAAMEMAVALMQRLKAKTASRPATAKTRAVETPAPGHRPVAPARPPQVRQ